MAEPIAKFFSFEPENGFITIFDGGEQHTIRASASNFDKAKSLFIAKDWDNLILEMNPDLRFKSLYAKYEAVEVKDGQVYVNGDTIHEVDARRILGFLAEGADCVPIFKFITRLQNNPSKRAVDELYKFLEHKNLPLTNSGTFLAYKAVREDYTDKHTGKFFNGVGEVLEMPRNKVDDNKEVGCSYGFHAGTLKYASDFMGGYGHLMVVEIDPADVVSIPTDCEFQKLRTCKYKVVYEYEGALDEFKVYQSNFQTDYDDDVDRAWDDDDNVCSGCGCDNHICEECDYCEECCECSQDDDEEEEHLKYRTGKKEYQQELDFDTDTKSAVPDAWKRVTALSDSIVKWMCGKQHIAVGMAIRRTYSGEMTFGDILKFTSEDIALDCYRALNK